MRESQAARQARAKIIGQRLGEMYPDAHCALDHRNALELLIATILSAQCTDVRVNLVTKDLFALYKKAADYAGADLAQLEREIKPTGFFRTKAKALKGVGEKLVAEFQSEVPPDLDSLMTLPGVGRKTANVVLGNAFRIALGIVVDTHVKRVAFRLGLTTHKVPDKVEQDLVKLVPRDHWVQVSHELIFHGRQVCKARGPACDRCALEGECPKRGLAR